ncbi:ankyrin repeat domain-containing protein [Paenibacillus sp. KQZ6P-2]|uniref:Ankyrin repeat domain-containing protein n=1 Tax=Paenibacillus mangrovi TaxID=2931978 RepID=A0A9X1WSL3_9BACL|nr:ankyrin repeat domain-containing protein [Paenibacillus mangrovi]MCJ8014319.1 ankyrin repeat domain-containing protein [Paenibacillus mangrovi]
MEHHQMMEELFQAAMEGNASRLRDLVDSSPERANMENADGLTLLGYAAHYGQAEAVRVLLAAGADVNAVSHSQVSYIPSNTALHAAIAGEKDMDVIRLLLDHKAGTRIMDSNGHTCLHTAAYHDDNVELIRLLLDNGAQAHEQTVDGETALTIAEKRGNRNVAELLRKNDERK